MSLPAYSYYCPCGSQGIGERALWNMSQMAERGWCTEAMMVWPSAARHDMWSIMLSAANASSPVVGSSRNRMLGLAISEHDIVSRRCSPPAQQAAATLSIPFLGSVWAPLQRCIVIDVRLERSQISFPVNRCGCQARCSPLRPRTKMPPGRWPPTCTRQQRITLMLKIPPPKWAHAPQPLSTPSPSTLVHQEV